MKRNLKLVALLVIAVLVCSGAWALTLARAERSESANIQQATSAPADNEPAAMNQGAKAYSQDVAKVLKRHDTVELEPQRIAEQVRLTGRLSIPTAEGTFDLRLVPHDMRSANYRAQATFEGGEVRLLERSPVRTYKGTVDGMEGAQARFTIDDNTLEGLIITPSQLYFVEPASRYSALASRKDFVVYKGTDLLQSSFGECGTLAEKVGAEAARVHSQVSTALGPGTEELFSPPRIVDLATEADFEYFQAFGTVHANNEILGIMNDVEGIYNTQFGLQFSIVFQNVWATAGDPYTSTDPDAALSEFANHWNSNRQGVARDLAHMWTGKDFVGTVVGIAFRPGMECPFAQSGYGVSQRLPGDRSPDKFLLTAHEIGHNFNATHPDQPAPGQPGCGNTIMASTLSSSTLQSFCPFSVNQIEAHANLEVACLSQALTPGCTYTLSPLNQTFAVGGGAGTVNVTTMGTSCVWVAGSTVDWITITSGASGTNSGNVTFNVNPNTVGFARSGVIRIAEQNFTVSQSAASGCVATPISFGQTINGALSTSDCRSSQRDFAFADQYSFSGAAGDQIRIEMSSTASPTLDTYLYLMGPTGAVLTENDDINFPNTNSRIPINGFFTLPAAGTFVIEATSFDTNETGTYTLVLTSSVTPTPTPTPTPNPAFFQFSHAAYSVVEHERSVGILVTRTGDTSTQQAVNMRTQGSPSILPVGTQQVIFAAGETYRIASLGIIDDEIAEASETANLSLELFSPGTSLGTQSSATLTILDDDTFPPNSVKFTGAALQNVSENAGKIDLTVVRAALSGGDLSQDAFVSYRTWVSNALETRDYSFAGGTLHFLPGETNKTITIFITNDVFDEPDETFTVQLSNPIRTRVLALENTLVSVQIQDDDPPGVTTNPSDTPSSFVTQHYVDFLNREPDASGLAFWTGEINLCAGAPACTEVKRINVSAAFFLSIEFQETGYLVYRLYKAAYGTGQNSPVPAMPVQDFMTDSQEIGRGVTVGAPGWDTLLEAKKQALVRDFVGRPRFKTALPPELTAAQFVDKLNTNIGGLLTPALRNQLVAQLAANNTEAGRASVLRTVAEQQSLRDAEFRKAFVLMQYFGYLRRNPNDAPDFNYNGYNFWRNKLDEFNGNFVQAEMVRAFILSSEYRQRFGP